MKHSSADIPTIENAEDMIRRSDEHHAAANALLRAALKALEKRYGLVPGVTRVRQDDVEGWLVESLNYERHIPPSSNRGDDDIFKTPRSGTSRASVYSYEKDKGRLWIRVNLDPPLPGPGGSTRKFYGDWTVV